MILICRPCFFYCVTVFFLSVSSVVLLATGVAGGQLQQHLLLAHSIGGWHKIRQQDANTLDTVSKFCITVLRFAILSKDSEILS
jgi:hypothetical protein